MLPHDLPDLGFVGGKWGSVRTDIPGVTPIPHRGVNPSYKVDTPDGPRFVKVIHHADESPHVEPAAAEVFRRLRLPHTPVEYAFRSGRHLNHAPWVEAKSLNQITPGEMERIKPQHIANTLFGEWLANVGDRHAGNYLVDESGPRSIDHGHAFGTDLRQSYGKPHERPSHLASMTMDPYQWYTRPDDSTLYEYGREYGGLHPTQRISNEHIAAALAEEGNIKKAVERATVGVHPAARDAIHAALHARYEALKKHVAEHGKLTVADLFDLNNEVHNSAQNYLQKTPSPV